MMNSSKNHKMIQLKKHKMNCQRFYAECSKSFKRNMTNFEENWKMNIQFFWTKYQFINSSINIWNFFDFFECQIFNRFQNPNVTVWSFDIGLYKRLLLIQSEIKRILIRFFFHNLFCFCFQWFFRISHIFINSNHWYNC
jgi:hypothetical protein